MGFKTKRRLKAEIVQLNYRIAELEERLCPCEQHDLRYINFHFIGGTGNGDEITVYAYKCRRCGKKVTSIHPLLNTKEVQKDGIV